MNLQEMIRRNPKLRSALAIPLALRRSVKLAQHRRFNDFLSRFEDLIVSDVRVRAIDFEGEFVIGPRSNLLQRLLLTGAFEPELARLFVSHIKPDRDVIDIGANIGFFSVLAARRLRLGRVLAAEPTNAAHARLVQNLEANGVREKVVVFHGLLAAEEASKEINIVAGREEFSSIGVMEHPSIAGQPIVKEIHPARPLDALVREHNLDPALIKIDVEGAEMIVFQGAQETLAKFRPVVLSEFTRPLLERNGTSPAEIVSMFDRLGYDVRDPFHPDVTPGDISYGDIIATPR